MLHTLHMAHLSPPVTTVAGVDSNIRSATCHLGEKYQGLWASCCGKHRVAETVADTLWHTHHVVP